MCDIEFVVRAFLPIVVLGMAAMIVFALFYHPEQAKDRLMNPLDTSSNWPMVFALVPFALVMWWWADWVTTGRDPKYCLLRGDDWPALAICEVLVIIVSFVPCINPSWEYARLA